MEHWRVEISINGEPVLSIEPGIVAGDPNPEKYKREIRESIEHVWSFMGFHEPDGLDQY